MLLKVKLVTITFMSAALLLFVLCLGSQNLNNRNSINLVLASTAPLPTGFIVSLAITLGFISGGSTKAILIPNKIIEDKIN